VPHRSARFVTVRAELIDFVNRCVARSEKRLNAAALAKTPRRTEFALTAIAVGTQTVDVSWTVPIPGDYAVLVSKTCAAQFVGFLDWSVQAGSKTPTGCTVIVANRAALQIGAATFDVLAFPL